MHIVSDLFLVQLSLDQLDFVEKEDEWKKLTLPKGHKQIVQAMVETHSSGSETSVDNGIDKIEMDLVRGKGMCPHMLPKDARSDET